MIAFRASALLAMLTLAASAAAAKPCPDGSPKVGDLGFAVIECNCSVDLPENPENRRWQFRSEPVIGSIRSGGPAEGRLMEGDVITAIDGRLITTREAGLRFARVAPGRAVVLRVRQGGEERTVRIVPGEICYDQALGVFAPRASTPRPPRAPRAPRAPRPVVVQPEPEMPVAVEPPETPEPTDIEDMPAPRRSPRAPTPAATPRTMPRGWLGVGLDCNDCHVSVDEGRRRWHFSDYPRISYVDPESPASRAGMERGDVITHVDGVSLLTREGGTIFGSMRPGQALRLGVRRGVRTLTITPIAQRRAEDVGREPLVDLAKKLRELRGLEGVGDEVERSLLDLERRVDRATKERTRPADRKKLRYSGAVGSSNVEVRGAGTVIISKDDATGDVLITTSDATIRVSPGKKDKD